VIQQHWELACVPYEQRSQIIRAMGPSRYVEGELGERWAFQQSSRFFHPEPSPLLGSLSGADRFRRTRAKYRRFGAPHDCEPAMKNQRFPIPLTSTLLAFEAVARNVSVNRAAEELNTSQSAISRHIRSLENALGVKVLARTGRGITLTENGYAYFLAVQRSMNDLETTAFELRTQRKRLTIACTSTISTLVMLPVFSRLRRRLGELVSVALVVYNGQSLDPHGPKIPDIVFDGRPSGTSPGFDSLKMLDEEIVPVASPQFAERFGSELSRSPEYWSTVPRLEMSARDFGWSTWNQWFQEHKCRVPDAPVDVFDDYVHLLRAAAEGEGLAIGRNGFLNDYVVDGRLSAIRNNWLRTGLAVYAIPTEGAILVWP